MIRSALLAAAIAMTGVVMVTPPSSADKDWQQNKALSQKYAGEGKWKRACRQALLAGTGMNSENVLTTDYMTTIGLRCIKAGS